MIAQDRIPSDHRLAHVTGSAAHDGTSQPYTDEKQMRPRYLVSSIHAALAVTFILFSSHASLAAETVRYKPVPRETVEARLRQYNGKDTQREQTLKQMFSDAGCADQHV